MTCRRAGRAAWTARSAAQGEHRRLRPRSPRWSGRSQPELICHLAAQIDVRSSVTAPAADAGVNVVGTVNVLEAARAAGARVLFCSSGGAVYGRDAPDPVAGGRAAAAGVAVRHRQAVRGAVRRPVQPAARHRALGAAAGQRVRAAAGPGRRGRRHPDLLRLRAGRASEPIFGDGTQTRDYVYVGDAVAAFLAAADRGPRRDLEHRHRLRGQRAGARWPSSGRWPAARSRRGSRQPRPGELLRSALAVGRAERDLGWRPATRWPRASARCTTGSSPVPRTGLATELRVAGA